MKKTTGGSLTNNLIRYIILVVMKMKTKIIIGLILVVLLGASAYITSGDLFQGRFYQFSAPRVDNNFEDYDFSNSKGNGAEEVDFELDVIDRLGDLGLELNDDFSLDDDFAPSLMNSEAQLKEIIEVLDRLAELSEEAANASSSSERKAFEEEADALMDEIDRIMEESEEEEPKDYGDKLKPKTNSDSLKGGTPSFKDLSL